MERLAGYKHNTGIVRRLLFKPQTKTQANTHTQEHNTKQKQPSLPPKKEKTTTKTAPTPQNNTEKKTR